MKKSALILAAVASTLLSAFHTSGGQDDLKIWKEFVSALKGDTLTLDQIDPLYGVPKEALMRQLVERKGIADRYSFWQDRARAAGWNLEIRYEDPECLKCVFHFTKK